jgi:predicted RecA/RadA family phage recombinase
MISKYASGKVLDYTVPEGATVYAGDPVIVGPMVGVAANTGTAGDTIAVNLHGVFGFSKADDEAFNQGDKVYWDSENEKVTGDATAGVLIGCIWGSATEEDLSVTVLIGVSDLFSPVEEVAVIGEVDAFTAVAETLANLSAAQIAINTLAGEAEARIATLEGKVDELITALINGKIIKS